MRGQACSHAGCQRWILPATGVGRRSGGGIGRCAVALLRCTLRCTPCAHSQCHHHLNTRTLLSPPLRIYSDGRNKDFKQGWFSWVVAVVTMTIYTGESRERERRERSGGAAGRRAGTQAATAIGSDGNRQRRQTAAAW